MITNQHVTPQFASMSEVVMKKDELLKALVENKARHDTLYEVSVSGYWQLAKEKLKEKKASLEGAIEELRADVQYQIGKLDTKLDNQEILPLAVSYHGFKWDSALGLSYPENHTKDYDRAIRMMQSSIYDEVKLSEHEFDQYVLNNWDWKNKFIASNSLYFSKGADTICSGYMPTTIGTGAYYHNARNETISSLKARSSVRF